MKKSMLSKKATDLDEWLKSNPNHADYTVKKRERNHLQNQIKQLEINAAFPK